MDIAKIGKKQKASKKKARTSKKSKGSRKVSGNQKIVEMPGPLQKDGNEHAAGYQWHNAGIDQEEVPSTSKDHGVTDSNPECEGLEAHSEDIIEVLVFSISGRHFAFRVSEVEEIFSDQKITFVPRAEPFLSGITSVRGRILPVLDIEKRLSLDVGVKTEGRPKIVVLRGPKGPVGVLIFGVLDIRNLREIDIASPPVYIEGNGANFIEATAIVGDRLISIIRTAQMLDIQETKESP